MIGNTNLTLKPYSNNSNNNGNSMIYVDVDSDSNTYNSSSSTLSLSTENGAKSQLCYNTFLQVYIGLVNPKTQTPLQRPNEFKMVRKQLTQLQLLIITKP
jgi:hypothetical protein